MSGHYPKKYYDLGRTLQCGSIATKETMDSMTKGEVFIVLGPDGKTPMLIACMDSYNQVRERILR
ncbi:hypothetical protein LCGC14_0963900 [marine sediment metagenome]|uniref:Uncharacterized protein n=1 Tax=marine sediment metagenome TaxID=412755 RepID=A0A0F9RK80_9ZZZZ